MQPQLHSLRVNTIVQSEKKKLKSFSKSSNERFDSKLKIFSPLKCFSQIQNVLQTQNSFNNGVVLSKTKPFTKLFSFRQSAFNYQNDDEIKALNLLKKSRQILLNSLNPDRDYYHMATHYEESKDTPQTMFTQCNISNDAAGNYIQKHVKQFLEKQQKWKKMNSQSFTLDELIKICKQKKQIKDKNDIVAKEFIQQQNQREVLEEYLQKLDVQETLVNQNTKTNIYLQENIDSFMKHKQEEDKSFNLSLQIAPKSLLSGKFYEDFVRRAEKIRKVQQKQNIFVYNAAVNEINNNEIARTRKYDYEQIKDKINQVKFKQLSEFQAKDLYEKFVTKQRSKGKKLNKNQNAVKEVNQKNSQFLPIVKTLRQIEQMEKPIKKTKYLPMVKFYQPRQNSNTFYKINPTKDWASTQLKTIYSQICEEKQVLKQEKKNLSKKLEEQNYEDEPNSIEDTTDTLNWKIFNKI